MDSGLGGGQSSSSSSASTNSFGNDNYYINSPAVPTAAGGLSGSLPVIAVIGIVALIFLR